MSYIDVPTDTSASDLSTNAFQFIQGFFPEWTPNTGALATILIQANSESAAEVKDVSSRVPATIFRYFGDSLADIPPINAETAFVSSTWKLSDTSGHTIENGTTVVVQSGTGEFIGFIVVGGPYIVSPGSNTTPTGAVSLQAVIAGEDANNLDSSNEASPQDQLAFVESITLVGTSSGGAEAETDNTYLNRLSDELKLQSPMPILASDFAILTQRIPGVYRATAVDNWNATTGMADQVNTVSIFAVDSNGNPVAPVVKTAITNYFESTRAQNFKVPVGDPNYTNISCLFAIGVSPGTAPSTALADAEQAVEDYLSPAQWGNPPGSDPAKWVNSPVVRVNKVIQVIENVLGVDYAQNVRLNGLSADVTMPGVAPLPMPGTITGTTL